MSNTPRPHRQNLFNFIIHGLKFVFLANPGPMQHGLSTAFAAPMLERLLVSGGRYNYVWPYAEGRGRRASRSHHCSKVCPKPC
ncbi:hypothetical protein [Shinella sp.]|uniref:hypothetical protein n=1 Tax=Shinella sp. TaxID=1870904 RepID=UPI002589F2B3|nr:hypothetical protein [Shinella sp.]